MFEEGGMSELLRYHQERNDLRHHQERNELRHHQERNQRNIEWRI